MRSGLALIFVTLLAGCGKVPDNRGADMGASSSGDLGAGGGSCTAGSPCQAGSGNGLCTSDTCSACSDSSDDAQCATVYGSGFICLDQACVQGCRTAADCGGKACVGNQCATAGCATDADCGDPSMVCNTAMNGGTCVAAAGSCGVTTNAACPINAADVCCGSSSACTPGSCCGTGACTVTTANDGTCQPIGAGPAGTCVLNSCAAPSATSRYVDWSAPSGGSGSMSCPLNDLDTALGALASTGGTVFVKGGEPVHMTSSTKTVGAGVNITGTDSSFVACTPTTCSDPTKWPTIQMTADYIAMNLVTAGARKLSYFNITGVGSAAKASGIKTSAATLSLDHVGLTGTSYGLYIDVGSSVTVGAGVTATANGAGAYIVNGGASTGGSLAIAVAAGDSAVHFDSNATWGIFCGGNGKLTINAPATETSASTALFTAKANGAAGIRFSSTVQGSITGALLANNGADASQSDRDGLVVFAKSLLKVRGSRITGNGGSGIHVVANGSNSADGLSQINLGGSYKSDPGDNAFSGNSDAGLCVDAGPADAASNGSLAAEGNTLSGTDCSSSTGTVSRAKTCTGGVDTSADCAGALDFAECAAGSCS